MKWCHQLFCFIYFCCCCCCSFVFCCSFLFFFFKWLLRYQHSSTQWNECVKEKSKSYTGVNRHVCRWFLINLFRYFSAPFIVYFKAPTGCVGFNSAGIKMNVLPIGLDLDLTLFTVVVKLPSDGDISALVFTPRSTTIRSQNGSEGGV